MEQTDEELVAGVIRKEEQAFSVLFARYRAVVSSHIQRIQRDEVAAEDLTQEVFLRIWHRSEQWKQDAAFKSWLLRIATNVSLNHLRTVKRRREQAIDPASSAVGDEDEDQVPPGWMVDANSASPDDALLRDEQRRQLQDIVCQLSQDKQEVIRMTYDDHMETRRVASELGIPEGTVKSRLHSARRQIARTWTELGLDWEQER